jgi:selenocysteine-specific elongation factor SelB
VLQIASETIRHNGARMSDIINGKGGLVLGTAGHIDHGKTTLVRALTGMETDRLAEEKKRGISIDLGFAHLTLPDQRRVALIDVPGHERFIKNMLAGVGGIDAVLLVVAADEGVKPQTREHFEICRLLGVSKGLVALTKIDNVREESIAAVTSQIRALCVGSFLEDAPIVPVSAHSGQGLDVLRVSLANLSSGIPGRPTSGLARLPVDRSFTMQGFGTVVTGTLWSGELKTGDAVEVHPLRERFRIRGLQVHGKPVARSVAGQRTAVNLAGVEARRIRRGFVLSLPETLETTQIVDTRLEWLDAKYACRSRQALHLHIGTSEAMADVRLIQTITPTQTLTRVSVREPLLILPGDRFVLRTPSTTIAGGSVIDAFPPIRLTRTKTAERLRLLAAGDEMARLELLVIESPQGRRLANLTRMMGSTPLKIRQLAEENPRLMFCEAGQRIVSHAWLEQKRQQVVKWLESFHTANPGVKGAPTHQIRSTLMSGVEPGISDFILQSIPQVRVEGDVVALAQHHAQLNPEEVRSRDRIEQIYRNAGFQPPSMQEALANGGVAPARARALLESLVKDGKLVRIGPDLIFHGSVLAHIRKSLVSQKGRRFSVPDFKLWTQISRKYAIPLLEYLDREHVTRRDGDMRIVL